MPTDYPEFFNDVFGPVMQPGSSSHTAGPCRLGALAFQLLGGQKPAEIRIQLDRNGSFAGTFGLMREDLGMLAGAWGLTPDDERMFDIRQILADEGVPYSFEYVDFPAGSHPNAVRFVLSDSQGQRYSLMGNSTGGGMVETVEVQGIPCRYNGNAHLTCLRTEASEEIFRALDGVLRVETVVDERRVHHVLLHSEAAIQPEHLPGNVIFQFEPILSVQLTARRESQLFDSFDPWIRYSEAHGLTLSEAAIEYERRASGWTKDQIVDTMRAIQASMNRQTESVYADETGLLETPYTGFHFRLWRDYAHSCLPLVGPVVARAMHYAFGVQALVRGVKLVPGPMGTGGGYLYSAMRAVQDARNLPDAALLDALFIAAGVGAIAYTRTNPTGEVTGCAGECGVCGAMAAAAITYMTGGSPRQVEAAASLTLQVALGWPCDPIPGGQNQPCMSRVLTAVVMSIVFSDAAMSGRDAVLPFHEMVDAMDEMGRGMSSDLLCTSRGGMCTTPTARRSRREFQDWYKSIL